MKVSKLALGLALAAGFGMASPSLAKDKKDAAAAQPAAWAPKLDKGFRNAAAPLQKAIQAKDYATAQTLLPAAEAAAQSPDEKFVLGQFKLQIATGTNDAAAQATAVNEMIASGSGPADMKGQLLFYQGQFAYKANNFPAAIQALSAAQQAGYAPKDANGQPTQDLNLLLAESYFKTNQVPQGLAAVDKAIQAEKAAGRKPPQEWYGRAASMAYKAKLMPEVAKWTRAQVLEYPSPENWRSALVIFGDANHFDDQTQLDLMRLQRFAGALSGERDYYEYAVLADKVGLPGEAQAVVNEGKAKGAYNASSKAVSDIGTAAGAKVAADKASLAAAEKSAASAPTGKAALGTADAYFGYGDYAKAAALYKLALQKGGVDANTANLRLGMALAKAGQPAEAKQALAQVTSGPRAELAQFWTLWVDQNAGKAG
ncbi:hypothetical protein SCH01S_19_00720 [Sphingomonas changbaiensis NBRC 104936]|uniref:Tetratricopeptide repeat protein n=1 Tax=Sphingomonas changbaiensis NBRC 104936 TaxID=1219043 RepID=A0A0E9MMM6_9SPHN|nr:hypothetical protein [Sphingomonas changbaiensis]GAO38768.1 hypothetical protein SCH01S_19_00720 [Sphingomonas changbaiensis NBRC 104936]